jgi:hypothetical protein
LTWVRGFDGVGPWGAWCRRRSDLVRGRGSLVAREEREFELEPKPARARSAGIDAGEPPRGRQEADPRPGHRRRGRRSGSVTGDRRNERRPYAFNYLVEEAPEVAPAVLKRVQDGDPRPRVVAHQSVDKPIDGFRRGEAQEVANHRFVEAARRG